MKSKAYVFTAGLCCGNWSEFEPTEEQQKNNFGFDGAIDFSLGDFADKGLCVDVHVPKGEVDKFSFWVIIAVHGHCTDVLVPNLPDLLALLREVGPLALSITSRMEYIDS